MRDEGFARAPCTIEEEAMPEYFKDWNYRKHAKLCAGVYAVLYVVDMTLGYVLVKRLLNGKKKQD